MRQSGIGVEGDIQRLLDTVANTMTPNVETACAA